MEIRELLKHELLEGLNERKKNNKISYFIISLKKETLIKNIGSDKKPYWVPEEPELY
jgi:hypothetical protein